jgi:hypothetical protein
MNIAQIKQQPVDSWVDFAGTILETKDIKQRVKSQMSKTPGETYYTQKLSVGDESGKISVHAYWQQGTQFQAQQKITIRGQLKDFNGNLYIDYATVKPFGIAPPQAQQASQPTTGQPKASQGEGSRPIILSILCAILSSNAKYESVEDLYQDVLDHAKFVTTGKINRGGQPNPDYVGDDPQLPEDDIPF